MDPLFAFQLLAVAIVTLIFGFLFVIFFTSMPPNLHRFDSEKVYYDPRDKTKKPFPSLSDPGSLSLSVVIPAYNEEDRLPTMMEETMTYLEKRQKNQKKFTYEIIIVDDGSKDRTTKVALGYSAKYGADKVRVLTFRKNRGKGGAVRMGMLSARGKLLLFADADGATAFADIEKLEKCIEEINNEENMAIVCGSRAHLEEEAIATRSIFRTFLMKGFHLLVMLTAVRSIRDTQCGFKLLTRDAACLVFNNLHVDRWAFDADLLYIAEHFKVPLGEVSVTWHEIGGSKIVPVLSWLEMGWDLVVLRLRYVTGGWDLTPLSKLR